MFKNNLLNYIKKLFPKNNIQKYLPKDDIQK